MDLDETWQTIAQVGKDLAGYLAIQGFILKIPEWVARNLNCETLNQGVNEISSLIHIVV